MSRAGVKSEAKKEVAAGLPARRARKLAGRPVYGGETQSARRRDTRTGASGCESTNTALTRAKWPKRICNHDETTLLDSRKAVFAAGPLGICRDWHLVSAGNADFLNTLAVCEVISSSKSAFEGIAPRLGAK